MRSDLAIYDLLLNGENACRDMLKPLRRIQVSQRKTKCKVCAS
jgi:hypothetical protein